MTPVPPVYLRHLACAAAADGAGLRGIWSPDGVLEFPYARGADSPGRLAGLDSLVDYFDGLRLFGDFRFGEISHWPLGDHDHLVEFHASSTLLRTGADYEQDYIVRFSTDRTGRLTWMREYWDPTRLDG